MYIKCIKDGVDYYVTKYKFWIISDRVDLAHKFDEVEAKTLTSRMKKLGYKNISIVSNIKE